MLLIMTNYILLLRNLTINLGTKSEIFGHVGHVCEEDKISMYQGYDT